MAYPEPIPILRGRAARRFLRRLEEDTLSPEVKEQYRGIVAEYRAMLAKVAAGKDKERHG
jgi:hypothetical protein